MTTDTPRTDKFYDMVSDREAPDYTMKGHPSKWSFEPICDFLDFSKGLERELFRIAKDAQRYWWLCDDLTTEQRAMRSHIFNRMSVMGKGAIDSAIDAALAEADAWTVAHPEQARASELRRRGKK